MLRILIADDHELFLDGLKMALSDLDDDMTIDVAHNHTELQEKADGKTQYDLILTDLAMPGMAWHESLRLLKEHYPDTPVAVLSAVYDREIVLQAVDIGAAGFIPKTSSNKIILSAIHLILSGGLYLPSELLGDSNQKVTTASGEVKSLLTPRQLDVLRLMGQGKPNKIIARELDLSEGTVKLHVTAILKALNVINRTGAVISARNLGLIE
ncbi:two component transcriptional regulator LuxR family [Acetobacter sp. CAG:977]|nr:two component transcriptional regulator LuxR family [Acetobacter sp. CAG:977]